VRHSRTSFPRNEVLISCSAFTGEPQRGSPSEELKSGTFLSWQVSGALCAPETPTGRWRTSHAIARWKMRKYLLTSSNSHFGIQPENSPPLAGCFQASKPRVRALRARTLGFEAHTENCWLTRAFHRNKEGFLSRYLRDIWWLQAAVNPLCSGLMGFAA